MQWIGVLIGCIAYCRRRRAGRAEGPGPSRDEPFVVRCGDHWKLL